MLLNLIKHLLKLLCIIWLILSILFSISILSMFVPDIFGYYSCKMYGQLTDQKLKYDGQCKIKEENL